MTKGILLPYQKRWVEDSSRFKIWLAARQIGKSFAATLEAALESVEKKTIWVYLSVGERQAKELADKTKLHLQAIGAYFEEINEPFMSASGVRYTSLEHKLRNGSRHIFLPANPDTARGYTANIFLDEFAFHKDAAAIWSALYPSITRHADLRVRIASTPNGKSGKFYDLWGGRDEKQEGQVWSRHRTDIFDAVREGLAIDPEALRLGLADDLAWAQEYLLEFTEENTAYLSYELIASCEDASATIVGAVHPTGIPFSHEPPLRDGDWYLGFDVGRHRDLSVIWLIEKVGDVAWTRRVIELRNTPFAAQREVLYGLLPEVRRACIDATGLGEQLAEEAKVKFGYKVEPVKFTAEVKNDLATTLRRAFEDRGVRIPIDRHVREDLHSVRRIITSAGNVRFDAERDEQGHADRFWALALALHGAHQPGGIASFEGIETGDLPRRRM